MMLTEAIKVTDFSSVLQEQRCQSFTLAEIESSTNNFDETLVIGRGGFGNVYKCLSNMGLSNEVAVKRLHSMSAQGAHEFEAEVKLLSKLRHGNLVSLVGYCIEGNEMILAYEFMPNGTLGHHLHKAESDLSWLQRLKICVGAAQGLDYLHTGTTTQHEVVHRDVKTSNILLDANFDAKISDFGLAKVGFIDQARTQESTAVKGTFGYMDPCYFYTGKLTRKSDVYAFGVVLFEVLFGKKAVDSTLDEQQWGLAAWAQDQIKEGKLNQIIDCRLMGEISKKSLKEFARIACQCLHSQPKQRPTMTEIVVNLESILSYERERANAVVDEGRLIYKVRSFFMGKVDGGVNSKSDFSAHHNQKSTNGSLRTFTYAELVSATNNSEHEEYSPALNEYIYKGWVDESTYAPTKRGVGLAMYVTKKHIIMWKPDIKVEDFSHPNLIKLLGYGLNEQELFYVCELNPGTSLDKYLYGEPGTTSPSWVDRLKIAVGTAEGLIYLHQTNQPAYIQFKTDLILVDVDVNARLSAFEVENSIVAFGSYPFGMHAFYAAPEWFNYQACKLDGYDKLVPPKDGFGLKSEIYAFGVVLLEMLTGMKVYDERRPLGKENLVKWANPLLADEVNLEITMDPKLQHNGYPSKGTVKFAQLVSSCLRPIEDNRPSMEEILKILYECYQEEINQFDS